MSLELQEWHHTKHNLRQRGSADNIIRDNGGEDMHSVHLNLGHLYQSKSPYIFPTTYVYAMIGRMQMMNNKI